MQQKTENEWKWIQEEKNESNNGRILERTGEGKKERH